MKITIKIGEIEVSCSEEHQLTSKGYDLEMQKECKKIAEELYEKYMKERNINKTPAD